MRQTRAAVSLALALLAAVHPGCAVWHPRAASAPAAAELPEFYREYYSYPPAAITEASVTEEKSFRHYDLRLIEFPLRLPSELAAKDPEGLGERVETLKQTDLKAARDLNLRITNRLEVYLPRDLKEGQRRPVVLVSPILGGNMVVDAFARYYSGRGYVAVLVHRKRVFWDEERDDMQQIEDYMRTSVIRLRQAVDWIEAQPFADPDRIAAFGISYGSVLHSVLAAVEPRIQHHVLAMPAGPIPDVIMHCPDRAITKLVRRVEEKYGWPREKIHADLRAVIKTDPLLLAPYVPRDKVTFYVALFDRVVGAGRSWDLWKAMKKPELKVLPFGHYGGVLVFPYLQTQSYLAIKQRLSQISDRKDA